MTESTSSIPRRRALLFRVVAALGACAIALILTEIACRIWCRPPVRIDPEYVPDPDSHHRPRPGYVSPDGIVRINHLGFRDPEDFPVVKPSDETRVLFIGDSFLFGATIPFDETFARRCEIALKPHTATKLRVINAGCPNQGPNHERAVLEHFGLPLSPDIVVLCFYVGNDVLDTLTLDWPGFTVGVDHYLRREDREPSLRYRLLMKSRLFQIIEATDLYQRIAHPGHFERQRAKAGHLFTQSKLLDFELRTISQWRQGAWDRPPLDDAWRRVEESIRGIVASTRKVGAEPLIFIIPDELQVDPARRAEVCQTLNLDEKDYDLEQPQKRVAQIAASLGVRCVDALAACRAEAKTAHLYLELDAHWTSKGHEVGARELVPALQTILARKLGGQAR